LQAVVDALMQRKASWHLKARLLKGIVPELRAAHDVGLTWLEVWKALKNAGYGGSYPQFCKTANRFVFPGKEPKHRNQTAHGEARPADETTTERQQVFHTGENPRWKARKETAARIAAEAKRIQEQEQQSQTEQFTMKPFKRRERD